MLSTFSNPSVNSHFRLSYTPINVAATELVRSSAGQPSVCKQHPCTASPSFLTFCREARNRLPGLPPPLRPPLLPRRFEGDYMYSVMRWIGLSIHETMKTFKDQHGCCRWVVECQTED